MIQPKQNLIVLVSSIGNKVELLRIWQQILKRNHGTLIGMDSNPHALAKSMCDEFIVVPELSHPDFWTAVTKVIQTKNVSLVLPTRGEELLSWAQFKEKNQSVFKNVHLAVSSPKTLEICLDKTKTYEWLNSNGFPTPFTVQVANLNPREKLPDAITLPCFAKDPMSSGSRMTQIMHYKSEVFALPASWILQPLLEGNEFTLNAYINLEGKCISLIPHWREKVTDGQVSQATTVKNNVLINLGKKVAESLPGVYGPLNIQVMWNMDPQMSPQIIDINPRFGGGYPLVHRAGGNFVSWLIQESNGQIPADHSNSWEEGLQFQRIGNQAYFTRTNAEVLVESNV